MSALKTHPCDACGGIGEQYDTADVLVWTCPVCLGAGRISDVTPASDAMADAETLRRFADHVWSECETYADAASGLPLLLDVARGRKQGGRLGYYQRKGRLGAVKVLISDATHAAFRAVPGLRD